MFCRNCGKEVPSDAKFCSFCGETTETENKVINRSLTSGGINFDREVLLHYLSMATCAIIIIMAFSKWIRIESWVISSDLSTWGLIQKIDDLSRYGETEKFSAIVTLLVFLMIAIVYPSAHYIYKAYHIGVRRENNDHIVYGYPAMIVIAIVCTVFVIISMLISSSTDYDVIRVYFNEKAYYIIGLACLNRFVLLPKLNRIIFYRKEQNRLKNDKVEI